MVMKADDRF